VPLRARQDAEADRVIEAMLLRDPLYRAADEELSPRVETPSRRRAGGFFRP
jgi:hypothetical protein